jgi:hypothetical protein
MNETYRPDRVPPVTPDVPLTDADVERVAERRREQIELRNAENATMAGPIMAILALLVLVGGAIYFWPGDAANTSVTENAPRTEQSKPAAPPANKPTTAPDKPQ